MFRFTQEPSSGSQSQCYGGIFRPFVRVYIHAQQVKVCRHNTNNDHIGKHSGTIPVVLARY